MSRMFWNYGVADLENRAGVCVDGVISDSTYQSIVWKAHREVTGEAVVLKVSLLDDTDSLCIHLSHWGKGKRWFDIEIKDEGYIERGGRRFHWMVQPLGKEVDDDCPAYKELSRKLWEEGVYAMDPGARQFVEVNGEIKLVDYNAYVMPEVDFTPEELEFAEQAIDALRSHDRVEFWELMVDGEENALLRNYIKYSRFG